MYGSTRRSCFHCTVNKNRSVSHQWLSVSDSRNQIFILLISQWGIEGGRSIWNTWDAIIPYNTSSVIDMLCLINRTPQISLKVLGTLSLNSAENFRKPDCKKAILSSVQHFHLAWIKPQFFSIGITLLFMPYIYP